MTMMTMTIKFISWFQIMYIKYTDSERNKNTPFIYYMVYVFTKLFTCTCQTNVGKIQVTLLNDKWNWKCRGNPLQTTHTIHVQSFVQFIVCFHFLLLFGVVLIVHVLYYDIHSLSDTIVKVFDFILFASYCAQRSLWSFLFRSPVLFGCLLREHSCKNKTHKKN